MSDLRHSHDGAVHRIEQEVFWRKDGSALPVEYVSTPVRENGRVVGAVVSFLDITERKAAEAARLRATSVLTAQQEAAIDGILIVDENRGVVSCNTRFREIWHIPDDVAASNNDDCLLECVFAQLQDPDAFLSRVLYLYAHPEENSNDELHLRDGRILDRYSAPVAGEDGKHYGRIWYVRDITERRRTEEALRQAHDELEMHVHERTMQLERAEEDYRSLFENAVDGIFQTRPDGSYLRANPALAVLYGYASPEELMAKLRATDLYVEAGRRDEFARLMREQDAVSEFKSAVRRKDGTIIWISKAPAPSAMSRGRSSATRAWSWTSPSGGGRRKLSVRVKDATGGWWTHSPEAIFVYCEDTIVYANAAARILFGASRPEDLLGRCVFDIIHPDTMAVARERARRSQQEGLPSALAEQKYLRLDGSPGCRVGQHARSPGGTGRQGKSSPATSRSASTPRRRCGPGARDAAVHHGQHPAAHLLEGHGLGLPGLQPELRPRRRPRRPRRHCR